MNLIHKREIIRGVPELWREQYARRMEYPLAVGETPAKIHKRLLALDTSTCSSEDIDEAIGVSGWASNRCTECRTEYETLVHIGDEPDYEARYVQLCESCLKSALRLLKGAR